MTFSASPTYTYRTGDDLLAGEFDPALNDGYLFDFVSELEYRGSYFKEKLQTILFAKHYRQSIHIESLDPSVNEILIDERSISNNGAGGGFSGISNVLKLLQKM
ncbi:MAG: hypothetical protein AAF600_05795 [Bacteroidota bacterium]